MQTSAPLRPVTIHSSWRGLATAAVSPTIVLGLGIWGVVLAGATPIPLVLTAVGATLAAVVAFDYPRRSVVRRDGIDRVCLLRVEHVPWERIVAFERERGAMLRRGWRPWTGGREPDLPPRGGLVARGAGRRRWLLIDRVESRAEFDRIRAIVERHAEAVVMRARPPADTVAPTHLYHRSREDRDGSASPDA